MNESTKISTCLLCNNYFDRNLLSRYGGLLKNGQEDGGIQEIGETLKDGQPFCSECYLALLELERCERIIRDTKLTQQSILSKLKNAVINALNSGDSLDSNLSGVRSNLVKFLKGNTEEESYDNDEASFHEPDNDEDIKPSLDELEGFSPAPSAATSDESERCGNDKDLNQKPRNKTSRNPAGAFGIKECIIPLKRVKLDGINLQNQSKKKKTKIASVNVQRPLKGPRATSTLVFYMISETQRILLFRRTPIQYSPSGFKCLEVNCTHEVSGIDYFAFQTLKKHIISSHPELNILRGLDETKVLDKRTCPICKANHFTSGLLLREHIFEEHVHKRKKPNCSNKVVCESCWKVVCRAEHHVHTWHHKNQKEKDAMLHGGKPIPASILKEVGLVPEQTNSNIIKTEESFVPEEEQEESSEQESIATAKESKLQVEDALTKVTDEKIEPNSEITQFIQRSRKGNYFYLIGKEHLYFQGVHVKFSPVELVCQALGCQEKFQGTDYSAFEQFRKHKEKEHNHYLRKMSTVFIKGSCPTCNKEFKKTTEVNRHIFNEHSPPVICPVCWKPCISIISFQNHIKTHSVKKEEECSPNEVQFRQTRRRELPLLRRCKICSKDFYRSSTYGAHMKTHEAFETRPKFQCSICGKQILSRPSLRYHMLYIHDWENCPKLECHFCHAKFPYKARSRLNDHMRRKHTRETPWVCETCGKGFPTKQGYDIHQHRHKLEAEGNPLPFQCEFCEKRYQWKKGLVRHQQKYHPEGLVT